MNQSLTLHLMGGFTLELNGRPLTQLRSQTTEALLIYLIAHKQPLRREFLADFFWDGRSQTQAAANLRAVLSSLRKHLADYLTITRHTVAFNHEQAYWVDAFVIEKTLQVELHADSPTVETLEKALGLYNGDFLTGFHLSESPGFEQWTAVRREHLHRLASQAWEIVVTHHHTQGTYRAGLQQAERWVVVDPLNESAQRQLMWLLARSGQRTTALSQYEKCRVLLKAELNIEPSAPTTSLQAKLRKSSWPPPHNLPAIDGPFIGRSKEIRDIEAVLLAGDAALLTLLGSGGDGKTRLAIEFCRQLYKIQPGRFLDGLFFLALAPFGDTTSFELLLAETLGVPLTNPHNTRDQLLAYLADKEMLLVLDNFETLLDLHTNGRSDPRTLLAAILKSAPNVRLLVTSRQRLQMRQENVLPLQGLPYPPGNGTNGINGANYESVQLFMRHTRRVMPAFRPTTVEKQAIAAICHQLQGMPLAIELAAPALLQTTAVALQKAITQTPDTLAMPWPDVEPRHRSIRAVFDYSWSMLIQSEQQLLANLSIFPDSFSETAAIAICKTTTQNIHALSAKSLLQPIKSRRYSLHPLIRRLAAEQCRQNITLLERHYRFYTTFLQQEENNIVGKQQKRALDHVADELDNVRLAWQTAASRLDFTALDKALPTLYIFFDTRGWQQEGEQILRFATQQIEAKFSPEWLVVNAEEGLVYGRILSRQAWFTYKLGDFAAAKKLQQQCEQLFLQLEAEPELAHVLHDQGALARRTGNLPLARALCLQSLTIRRRLGGRKLVATLITLANIERTLGNFETARQHLLEANTLLQKEPEPIYQASVLNDLGEVMRASEDFPAAKAYYEQSLALYREVGDAFGTGASLINLGFVAYHAGNLEQAYRYANDAYAAFKAINNSRVLTYPITLFGRIAQDKGDYNLALSRYQEALKLANSINYTPKVLNIIFEMATLLADLGDAETAVTLITLVQAQTQTDQETQKRIDPAIKQLSAKIKPDLLIKSHQKGSTWTLAAAISFLLAYMLK
ncbi:MAG: tetratricopeptide repeat protein [Anaerolineales bacterium]|nr:tetratricopeptide repeat protein [Anaerolineales bacterium]